MNTSSLTHDAGHTALPERIWAQKTAIATIDGGLKLAREAIASAKGHAND